MLAGGGGPGRTLAAASIALAVAAAVLAVFARGQSPGKPGGKPPQRDNWKPGVTMKNSKVCKVMAPLWLSGRRLLGGSSTAITDQECMLLHEYYKGPHLHPKIKKYGYKVPTDCLGYVGIYKSASSDTLCNLRNNLGKRSRWKHGMGSNLLQRMIQIHMFPALNESDDAVVDPKTKYYEDNPQDLARAQREGRPRQGTAFTWVREPALRFVSGYSEIEYYFTVGEPYFFYDIVLHSPKQREEYKPGQLVNQNKRSCHGCSFWNDDVNSIARAKQFVLDFLMLGMRPDFLWRHIFPQVAQANVFYKSAGHLDFVCHLEEFQRGWEFAGMMINRSLDTFNKSCRGHGYSGSGSGFEPREAMKSAIFSTEGSAGASTSAPAGGPSESCAAREGSEACRGPQATRPQGDAGRALATLREALEGRPGVEGAIGVLGDELAKKQKEEEPGGGGAEPASDVARALGCALLLPDYVCFGYKNIASPADCVAAGFADSVQQWEQVLLEVRRMICPGVRRFIGGQYDAGPLDSGTVREIWKEKLADEEKSVEEKLADEKKRRSM